MKILITGGAGFIGSHLARKLIAEGNSVSVIDNLSTGSIDNLKDLQTSKRFKFKMDTILNETLMKKLITEADTVYHLAAAVGVKYIIDNPLESIQTNIKGSETVFELANLCGKKKVIFASTSEVYGKNMNDKASFKENDDSLLGPTTITRWSYACAKQLDEFLGLAYYREKKLPLVILRFFNICGPRQSGRYGMVIPRFVKQALLGQPITIFGDGSQTRSFTHVYDAVEAITKVAAVKKAEGEVFNLGNPNAISIQALAEKIKKMTCSKSEIVYVPYEKAYEKGFEDMMHRRPSIDKLSKLINFKPKNTVDDILKDVIKYLER